MWWWGRKNAEPEQQAEQAEPGFDLGAIVPVPWDDNAYEYEYDDDDYDGPTVTASPAAVAAQPAPPSQPVPPSPAPYPVQGKSQGPAHAGPSANAASTPQAAPFITPPVAPTVQNAKPSEPSPTSARLPRPSLKAMAAVIGGAAFLVAAWLGANIFYYTLKFPNPLALQHERQTPVLRILARDGTQLAERGGAHPYMPLVLLPRHAVNAVVAIEDRRFFRHWGVDPEGLVRAALVNMRAGRFRQGGSTLTQQLAKNMFLSPERTMTRKLDELVIAIWLETRLTKDEILELYLNRVYYGGGSYGIESAAQRYFGKSARALSVAESAILAGLLKAPSRFAPSANPGLARRRGQVVLAKMRETGLLSEAAFQKAKRQQIRFHKPRRKKKSDGTEYAVDFVLERMPEVIDARHGEVIVETTLDAKLQRHAHTTVTDLLKTKGHARNAHQAALVVMDVAGGVRAMVGGADYTKSQFNRAVKARRQPGSTFKPFVYLTALEDGLTPGTTTYDLPISIKGWSPRNANNQYSGAVSLRDALSRSINTVAVRLALDAGPERVAATANRLGIEGDLGAEPSLALGTSEVSLLQLVTAYNTFAAGGEGVSPHIISRIRSTSGRVMYAHAAASTRRLVARPHVAAMNDMLNAALVAGTGRRAGLPRHPAAGKTGTSQGFRDAWFVGYTAHMTAGIWLGNDKGAPMKKVSGGSLPAQIWRKVMRPAHANLDPLPLPGTAWQGTHLSAAPQAYRSQPAAAMAPDQPSQSRGQITQQTVQRRAVAERAASKRVVKKPMPTPPLPRAKPRSFAAHMLTSLRPHDRTVQPARARERLTISPPPRETAFQLEPASRPVATPPIPHRMPQVLPLSTGQRFTARAYPTAPIPDDLFAQAAGGSALTSAHPQRTATSTGFDADDIRRRLFAAPARPNRSFSPPGMMTLGSDPQARQ